MIDEKTEFLRGGGDGSGGEFVRVSVLPLADDRPIPTRDEALQGSLTRQQPVDLKM